MNLILDMDNTLICFLVPRPHLEYFFEECFKLFKNVGIWTAANREWFNYVNYMIFEPILEKINQRLQTNYCFDFVFDSKKCTRRIDIMWGNDTIEKRVRKLHKSKHFPDYTIDNIVVVDDNPNTFRANYGNAVLITPYTEEIDLFKDEELLKLINYFKNTLIPHFNENGTIRNLDKRGWSYF